MPITREKRARDPTTPSMASQSIELDLPAYTLIGERANLPNVGTNLPHAGASTNVGGRRPQIQHLYELKTKGIVWAILKLSSRAQDPTHSPRIYEDEGIEGTLKLNLLSPEAFVKIEIKVSLYTPNVHNSKEYVDHY